MPDWKTIKHNDLYGINNTKLTLADVDINREGDYKSKLFFINIDDKLESIIFTIYPKEIAIDGKIIKATIYFNKLNGEFFDGYKIENGKIIKRLVVRKNINMQKAGFFTFFQTKEEEDEDCWNKDNLPENGKLDEVFVYGTSNGGGTSGSSSQSTQGTPVNLNFSSVNWYYLGNGDSSGVNYTGGGGAGIVSGAGTIYANDVKQLAEGETECPKGYLKDSFGNCIPNTNCTKRTGLLHDANFTNRTPVLGNNTTITTDNFRNDSWGLIQETDCGNGRIPKGSIVNVTSVTPVVRTLASGAKLKYYRVEYNDCPKGNNNQNGNYDNDKPCSDCFKGNPTKKPEIAAQLGPSGIKGGMYGKTRSSNTKWHRGVDIKTELGDPIYAMFDGTATLAQQGNGTKGAGYYVVLKSAINGKTVKSLYFHLEKDTRVSGEVKAGDIIGYQGDSGNLKKAIKQGYAIIHLHIKVKENGKVVDPEEYMKTTFNDTTGVSEHSADCD